MHNPCVARKILILTFAVLLAAAWPYERLCAAQAPAFYTNMIIDFSTGKPVYLKTPGNDVSGRLLDLVPDPASTRMASSRLAAPLAAYSGILAAGRNASDTGLISRAIGDTAAIAPLSLPFFDKLLSNASTGPGAITAAPDSANTAEDDGKVKIDIRGFRYIKFRNYGASGDSQSFLSQNGLFTYGDTIEQGTSLQFSAVRDDLQVNGTINELPLQERDLAFDILYGPYAMKLGDFNSEFKGGSLASLNKRITGVEVQYESDKFNFGFVSSQARSQSRTISFNGNNTHGPFDLNTFEIVPGSVQVLLNGQPVAENLYDLDYYSGQITFCSTTVPPKCTNIKTSDTVQVIFEQKLLLALTAGNVQGMRGSYNLPGGRGDIGVAYLTQAANRAAQRTRKNDTETFTGDQLLAQGLTSEAQRTISLNPPNNRFQAAGFEFLVRNTITVHKNGQLLDSATGFSVPYTGYARGNILLTLPPAASDTFTVSYSYYVDDYINVSQQEEIRETGDIVFTLARSQIYAGSETVYYCTNTTCTGPEILQPGPNSDYEIDEANNTLIIHSTKKPNEIDGVFLQITYYYVPAEAPESSEFDHTVRNIFGTYKIGANTTLKFEHAASQSDAGKTPIQIMNEIVARPNANITCPATLTPAEECLYTLSNVNIEENSEIIRFNNNTTALRRGADYNIDIDTSRISFTGGLLIPAGTIIYANYRYNPDIDLGLVSGSATRLSADTSFRNITLSVNKEQTDTFFAPIGGNNTLETGRLDYTLTMPLSDTFTISTTRSRFDTAEDIFQAFFTTTRDNTTNITWSPDSNTWLQSFTWSFGNTDRRDNRPTPGTDNTRDANSYEFKVIVPWLKNMTLDYALGSEDFSDNTGLTDNTASTFNDISLSYKPRNELSLDFTIQKTGVNTSGPTGANSTSNTARNMILTWQPAPLVTLTADMDSQQQTNSSPTVEDTTIDTTTVRLTTLPFWKIRVLTYSLTQQDRPSQFTGGTQSDFQTLSLTADAGAGISITPTITRSNSSSASTTSSTNLNSLRIEYLPALQPWEAAYRTEWSDTTSTSDTAAPTTSDTRRLTWDLKYKFTPVTHILYRLGRSTTTSSTSAAGNSETRQTLQLQHQAGDRWDLRASYIIFDRTSTLSTSERNIELDSEYRLSEILTWNLTYRIIGYSAPQTPGSDYNGHILETELRLQF